MKAIKYKVTFVNQTTGEQEERASSFTNSQLAHYNLSHTHTAENISMQVAERLCKIWNNAAVKSPSKPMYEVVIVDEHAVAK